MKSYKTCIVSIITPKSINDSYNIGDDLVEDSLMCRYYNELKRFLDDAIENKLGFESFENPFDRLHSLRNRWGIEKVKIDMNNLTDGAVFLKYDLAPEIKDFYVEIKYDSGIDFIQGGVLMPRIIMEPYMQIKGLDYIKKPR